MVLGSGRVCRHSGVLGYMHVSVCWGGGRRCHRGVRVRMIQNLTGASQTYGPGGDREAGEKVRGKEEGKDLVAEIEVCSERSLRNGMCWSAVARAEMVLVVKEGRRGSNTGRPNVLQCVFVCPACVIMSRLPHAVMHLLLSVFAAGC